MPAPVDDGVGVMGSNQDNDPGWYRTASHLHVMDKKKSIKQNIQQLVLLHCVASNLLRRFEKRIG